MRAIPLPPRASRTSTPIKNSAFDAIKATPLSDAKIYVAGTASTYKDIQDGAKYDLMIAALAAMSLILLIMMFITRSLVAAVVIVGTVVLSLGASFGLSVLVWQYIFGIQLYWIVLALAIILLLAVGADYNLLLISRFKEEIGAGLKTGIIRAMAGTGGVVTAAGLVFAATMSSFIFSDLVVLGQIGTTIGLGLLFDTLIVRSFMTPSIAALLGRWFWWPQNVRPVPPAGCCVPTGPAPPFDDCLSQNQNRNQKTPPDVSRVSSSDVIRETSDRKRSWAMKQPLCPHSADRNCSGRPSSASAVRRASVWRPPDEPAPKEPTSFSPAATPIGSPSRWPTSMRNAPQPSTRRIRPPCTTSSRTCRDRSTTCWSPPAARVMSRYSR